MSPTDEQPAQQAGAGPAARPREAAAATSSTSERRGPCQGHAAQDFDKGYVPVFSPNPAEGQPSCGPTGALLEGALACAALGWPVFRCRTRDKRPHIEGWQREATADAAAVHALWRSSPAANVGLACGPACWVLDVDGEEGLASLAEIEDRHSRLPHGPASATGSGGLHLFFAPSDRVKNSVRRLGAELDTRAAGGLVVLPPSVHPNGNRYAWLPDRAPWQAALPEAPAWLLDMLHPPPRPSLPSRPVRASSAYVEAAVRAELERVALAGEGQRNATLNRAAFALGRFVASGELDARDVGPAVVGVALAAGLSRTEAERTVASGLRAAVRRAA